MTNESQVTTIDDVAPKPAVIKPTKVKPSGGPVGGSEASGEMVMITIHQSNEFDGREAVPVGHNERVYQIPRGKPCLVPKAVAQIIVDAVTERYDASADGKGATLSMQPRFAYTLTPA